MKNLRIFNPLVPLFTDYLILAEIRNISIVRCSSLLRETLQVI